MRVKHSNTNPCRYGHVVLCASDTKLTQLIQITGSVNDYTGLKKKIDFETLKQPICCGVVVVVVQKVTHQVSLWLRCLPAFTVFDLSTTHARMGPGAAGKNQRPYQSNSAVRGENVIGFEINCVILSPLFPFLSIPCFLLRSLEVWRREGTVMSILRYECDNS